MLRKVIAGPVSTLLLLSVPLSAILAVGPWSGSSSATDARVPAGASGSGDGEVKDLSDWSYTGRSKKSGKSKKSHKSRKSDKSRKSKKSPKSMKSRKSHKGHGHGHHGHHGHGHGHHHHHHHAWNHGWRW